ncbi:MAG: hypothetical protein V1685_03650 [Parcubacteria group bacterium]
MENTDEKEKGDMKITFFSTRLGNKFFFISNLTEWHFSSRKAFNRVWLQQTGPFTDEEKKALHAMTVILAKYRFGNRKKHWRYLGEFFMALPESRVWPRVRRQVTNREFKSLEKIFDVFEPRFAKIWKGEEKNIQTAQKTFGAAIRHKRFLPLVRDLYILFRKNLLKERLTVLVCLRPKELPWYIGGGSAIFGKNRFSLEAGDVNPKRKLRLRKMLSIFFHEATHAALAAPAFERKIERFLRTTPHGLLKSNPLAKQGHSPYTILNEGIVSSLFSLGYLDEKYFHAKLDKTYKRSFSHGVTKKRQAEFHAWRMFAAYHLRPLLIEYLKRKAPLDTGYIKATFDLFQRFSRRTTRTTRSSP